jgi:hypothetical protein
VKVAVPVTPVLVTVGAAGGDGDVGAELPPPPQPASNNAVDKSTGIVKLRM